MDKYVLRRLALQAIRDGEPSPMDTEEVLDNASFALPIERRSLDRADVIAALDGLAERGYLDNLRPGRAPLWRLTAAGRGQIDREDDLAEYVWGAQASRFSR